MNIVIFLLSVPLLSSAANIGDAFFQNEYKMTFERAVVKYIDKTYLSELKLENVVYNRTSKVYSIFYCAARTLTGSNFKLNIKAYKLAYNVPKDLMLQFDVKVCDMLKNNVFGAQEMLKHGNATKCPILKGCYKQVQFSFDATKFPPLIPPNNYRIDLSYFMGNALFAEVNIFCDLKYEVKKY